MLQTPQQKLLEFAKLKVFNELNHQLIVPILFDQLIEVDSFTNTIAISTSQVGPMAPMFKSIECEVEINLQFDHPGERWWMHIIYSYRYTHPSGSNGYSIRYVYNLNPSGNEIKLQRTF